MTTEVIEGEATEVVVRHEPERGLARAENPQAMIALATELADALKHIVEAQKLYTVIQGKKFPQVEAWMTIGRMDNVVAREAERPIRNEDGSYEAFVELIRLSDGMIVGRASAMCGSPDDKPWSSRSEPNRRSMAVTRATSRAFRQQYSWIMALAGYQPTPADEMPPSDGSPADHSVAHPVAEAPVDRLAPWLDIPDITATGVVSFGSQVVDGNLRETPDGHLFGFKLAMPDGKKIPQVILMDALALAAASEPSLAKQTVTAHGDLWRVPWDKDSKAMPPYQRLIVTRLETPDWTIPAPISAPDTEVSSPAESGPLARCGVGSPYEAADSCGLEVEHSGMHKSVDAHGAITGSWPA